MPRLPTQRHPLRLRGRLLRMPRLTTLSADELASIKTIRAEQKRTTKGKKEPVWTATYEMFVNAHGVLIKERITSAIQLKQIFNRAMKKEKNNIAPASTKQTEEESGKEQQEPKKPTRKKRNNGKSVALGTIYTSPLIR
jgi:hypothetical protein